MHGHSQHTHTYSIERILAFPHQVCAHAPNSYAMLFNGRHHDSHELKKKNANIAASNRSLRTEFFFSKRIYYLEFISFALFFIINHTRKDILGQRPDTHLKRTNEIYSTVNVKQNIENFQLIERVHRICIHEIPIRQRRVNGKHKTENKNTVTEVERKTKWFIYRGQQEKYYVLFITVHHSSSTLSTQKKKTRTRCSVNTSSTKTRSHGHQRKI